MAASVQILYGSETGNCESISKILLEQCGEAQIKAERFMLNDIAPADLAPICLFVVSSTGQGEPPENMRLFMRAMATDPNPDLAHVKFTILGLGDQNYESY
jgi:sulfite reductase (NADPH) flavoprotein alpha-component